MTELKPCPFCGGEANTRIFDKVLNVGCPHCDIRTRFMLHDELDAAIEAWNTRHVETCDKLSEYADKLRVYPGVMSFDQVARGIDSIAEDIESEIEAEISDRYMPLPLDADGVPCRVGDMLIYDGSEHEVLAVDTRCVWFDIARRTIALEPFPADECHHVKPRTIEDVLDDYRRELVETWACTLDDEMTDAEDEITARYADELRGMK